MLEYFHVEKVHDMAVFKSFNMFSIMLINFIYPYIMLGFLYLCLHKQKPNAGRWVDPLSIFPTRMPMKLRTMRYSKAMGDINDIEFLRFILSNLKALKTLTVECDATLSSKE